MQNNEIKKDFPEIPMSSESFHTFFADRVKIALEGAKALEEAMDLVKKIASMKRAARALNVQLSVSSTEQKKNLGASSSNTASNFNPDYTATVEVQGRRSSGIWNTHDRAPQVVKKSGLLWGTIEGSDDIPHPLTTLREHAEGALNKFKTINSLKKLNLNSESLTQKDKQALDLINRLIEKIFAISFNHICAIARMYNTAALAPIVAALQETLKELKTLRDQQTDALLGKNSRYHILNAKITETETLV